MTTNLFSKSPLRHAFIVVAATTLVQSCGSVPSEPSGYGSDSLTQSPAQDPLSPATTLSSDSSKTIPLPPTTKAQPVRPTPPTTAPAITLSVFVPDSLENPAPSSFFDPSSLVDVRGELSKSGSPTGVLCVVFENLANAGFNFGFAETGYIDRKDLPARMQYLSTQLDLSSAAVSKILDSGSVDSSIAEFARALQNGVADSLTELQELKAGVDDPATTTIDKMGAILASNLTFEKLPGFDAFQAAAAKDTNCAI